MIYIQLKIQWTKGTKQSEKGNLKEKKNPNKGIKNEKEIKDTVITYLMTSTSKEVLVHLVLKEVMSKYME